MLTATTITDAQICELREELLVDPNDHADFLWCKWALDGSPVDGVKEEARARCAAILNARAKEIK